MPPLPPKFSEDWQRIPPAPVRRFLARTIDLVVFSAIFTVLLVIILSILKVFMPSALSPLFILILAATLGAKTPYLLILILVMGYIIFVPLPQLILNPISMALTGSTPGKWAMGILVTDREARKPALFQFIKRELAALGLGNLFNLPYLGAMIPAWWYYYLKRTGITPWDNFARTAVIYKNKSWWAMLFSAILILLVCAGLLFVAFLGVGINAALAKKIITLGASA